MSNRVRIKKPDTGVIPGKAIVAYLHPGQVEAGFMRSILNMVAYDGIHNRRLIDGGGLMEMQAGANLSQPRNNLVGMFKAHGRAEWMLMVDADMEFPPTALDQLIAKADPVERPIVGGLCFGLEADGRHTPTLFDVFKGPDGNPQVGRYREWPPDSLMRVGGTGTAFLLIHHTVFKRFDELEKPDGTTAFNDTFPYFQETEYFGKPIGEDLTFCFRAGFAGMPVYVDTSLHIGHIKTRVLNFASYVAEYQPDPDAIPVPTAESAPEPELETADV
jgi:hypothetical protein